MKQQQKTTLRRILHGFMAVCVVGILVSALILIRDHQAYETGDAAYQQVRQIWQQQATDPAVVEDGAAQQDLPSSVDFTLLAEMNPEVVAWLTAEDGEIDYPVVQGADNAFYLRHLFTGEQNKLGAIFMDYRNQDDFSDDNTVIYGHNMRDGSMFASLTKYKEQGYYESFPTMTLYTPEGNYRIAFFAGIVADGKDEFVRFNFTDAADFAAYIAEIKGKSTFSSDILPAAGDRIITLCTCSYEFTHARYALFGKISSLTP